MGCHFRVQPADVAKISELPSDNYVFTPSAKWAAKNNNTDFWNLSLLHSAWVCLNQISSVQTFIKLSPIEAFCFVLKMKPGGMFILQIVWLVCSLSPFFAIDFDGTMSKYAGVWLIDITDKWKGKLSNSCKSSSICAKLD